MEHLKKYFDRTGKIYGVSSNFEFGRWSHVGFVFNDFDQAIDWLHTDQCDFRELCTMTSAKELCGRGYVFHFHPVNIHVKAEKYL